MATSATARRTTILAVILWIAFKPILDILSILCNCHHINTSLASMGVSTEPPCHSYSISDCTWGGIAVFPPCLFVRTHNVVENTLQRNTTTLSIKLNQVNVNYLKIKSVTLFGSLQLLKWIPISRESIYLSTWYFSNLYSNDRSNKGYSGQSCEWV